MDPKIKARLESKSGKTLYGYQKLAIDEMMQKFVEKQTNLNLLLQLHTGGGKIVIDSELAKKFILSTGKKVLILTHRSVLLGQTSKLLSEIGVPIKEIFKFKLFLFIF